jgi:hypothetical protein
MDVISSNSVARVLELLKENTPTALALVEQLVGKPIKRAPPARDCYLDDQEMELMLWSRLPDERDEVVIIDILPRDGRVYNTGKCREKLLMGNYRHFKLGRSMRELLRLGVSHRSIHKARAEGWLKMGPRENLTKGQRDKINGH